MIKYITSALLGGAFVLIPWVASAADWYVDLADGTMGGSCTQDAPCLVPQDPVAAGFVAGDTIYLRGSTTAQIGITEGVLDGTEVAPTVIAAWPEMDAPMFAGSNEINFYLSNANHIVLDGFQVSNATITGIELNTVFGSVTDVVIRNCFVTGIATGVVLNGVQAVTLQNNTIANSTMQGVQAIAADSVLFANNIFANNADFGLVLADANTTGVSYSTATVSTSDYNDFYGNTMINDQYPTLAEVQTALGFEANSLEVDPMFVVAGGEQADAHLLATSALIDAGYDISTLVTTDTDGENRRYGPAVDIGIDELPSLPAPQKLKAGTKYCFRVTATYTTDFATYSSATSARKAFTTKGQ